MKEEDIYKDYCNIIDKVCSNYNGCKTPFEDRKQECLIAIFECTPKFENVQNLKAYIRKICINTNKRILRDEHLNGLHIIYNEEYDFERNEIIYKPFDPWVEEYREKCRNYSKNYRKNVIYADEARHKKQIEDGRRWNKKYRENNKEIISVKGKIYRLKKKEVIDLEKLNQLNNELEILLKERKIKNDNKRSTII
jgi:hypothetical protein